MPDFNRLIQMYGLPAGAAAAGGLLAWWLEDELDMFIKQYKWALPVAGALTSGIAVYVLTKK